MNKEGNFLKEAKSFMEDELIAECVSYFKNNHGFKRTFFLIRKKYESLGTLGGTVVLNNLKEEEKEALTGLFRKDYYKKSASFKVEAFIKALDNTRFQGLDFTQILEKYFGEKLLSKKEEKALYEAEKQLYFKNIIEIFGGTRAELWLEDLLHNKDNAFRIISIKYDEDKKQLNKILTYVCSAYNALSFDENNVIRLALFSSNITKNPHSFDANTDCGNLLVYAICHNLKLKYPDNAEELNEVLYRAGLITDEVSNYTLCSGVLAYLGEEEHFCKDVLLCKDVHLCKDEHIGWRGFYEAIEPLQVSLWNLSKINKVISPKGKVYVFENPTVFSEVLHRIGYTKPSLMCTFGNFKLASLILLDKLVKGGAVIYYSGDFDPEGIVMAEKLKQRYGEKIILWRYTKEDYIGIKSNIYIEDYRMKKMNNIKSKELKEIIEAIGINKVAGYQELLIDKYIDDILNQ